MVGLGKTSFHANSRTKEMLKFYRNDNHANTKNTHTRPPGTDGRLGRGQRHERHERSGGGSTLLMGSRTSVAKRLRYAADARTPHCGARTSAAPLGAVLARFRTVLRFPNWGRWPKATRKLRRAEPRLFGRRNAASGHPGRSGGALLRWSGGHRRHANPTPVRFQV